MTGYSGDTINVNDPGYSQSTYAASDVTDSGSFTVTNGKLMEAENNFLPNEVYVGSVEEFIPT